MQTCEITNKALEEQIKELYEKLNELQYNQAQELTILQKNHGITMKKLSKLEEYNKISDMTNQIFEVRLTGIEQALKQLNKTIGAQKS